jgi:hypothetical protein
MFNIAISIASEFMISDQVYYNRYCLPSYHINFSLIQFYALS